MKAATWGSPRSLPPMGGALIMSIRDQEYGARLDYQQLYPFRTTSLSGWHRFTKCSGFSSHLRVEWPGRSGRGSDGWAFGFCGAVWDGGAVHRALGRASLARRFCVFGLPRAGGLAAEGSTAGLRVRHLPPAGVGDGGDRGSSDADGSDEVVSCRLSDGSRQARRLGQISAAGTGGGVPDGVDHGAQVAPRAERGSGPSAARVPRGG